MPSRIIAKNSSKLIYTYFPTAGGGLRSVLDRLDLRGSPRSFRNSSSPEFLLKTQPTTPTHAHHPNARPPPTHAHHPTPHALSSPAVFLCHARPASFTTTRPVSWRTATKSSRAAEFKPPSLTAAQSLQLLCRSGSQHLYFLKNFSSSAQGCEFSTSSAPSQARRACATPKRMKESSESLCASVEIAILSPSDLAFWQ